MDYWVIYVIIVIMITGIINLKKEAGMTSHDAVFRLRRLLREKKIGHGGTLDPDVVGVLPIAVGKATRVLEFMTDSGKVYEGEVTLGFSTTTEDSSGELVAKTPVSKELSEADVDEAIASLVGDITQIPPMYSAVKVNGKKLYEYARKGEEVEIKPRSVNISELKILNYDQENRILELYIKCSKGTYIRSIAHDLGKNLGCFGHLIKLVRVKAGDFEVENSIKLEDLADVETVQKHLIYPLEKLDYQTYELNTKELELVSHGMQIFAKTNLQNGIVILTNNNKLIAIAEMLNDKIKCSKVFI